MAWTENTKSLLDEIVLQGCEDTLRILNFRLNKDSEFRSSFRIDVVNLLNELWPADDVADNMRYVRLISNDIEKMPHDLLDKLSDCLSRQARSILDSGSSKRCAAKLIAGWLNTKAIEIRQSGAPHSLALKLKGEHETLCLKLFEVRRQPELVR